MPLPAEFFQPVDYSGIDPRYALELARMQASTNQLAQALAAVPLEAQRLQLQRLETLNRIRARQKELALQEQRNAMEAERIALEKQRAGTLRKEANIRARRLSKEIELLDQKVKAIRELNGISVELPTGQKISLGTLLQIGGGTSLLKGEKPDEALQKIGLFTELYRKTGLPVTSMFFAFGKIPSGTLTEVMFKREMEKLGENPELFDKLSTAQPSAMQPKAARPKPKAAQPKAVQPKPKPVDLSDIFSPEEIKEIEKLFPELTKPSAERSSAKEKGK